MRNTARVPQHPIAVSEVTADRLATLGPDRHEIEIVPNGIDVDRITLTGFLDEYEDVLAHMKAARVFASPSTREGFGITYLEAMAAGCTVIGADHPESAAGEVIDDAGFVVAPTTEALASALNRALAGNRPPTDPTHRADQYDWDAVTAQAESVYRGAIDPR